MDGSLDIMECSSFLRFCYSIGLYPLDGSLIITGGSSLFSFFSLMDGSLVIMDGSLLLEFCYSNGWYPCHYGR